MYVPRQVGIFFPLLFFLKVASFACIDGMCSNFILQVFSFCFQRKKKSSQGGGGVGLVEEGKKEFEFVLVSPHHEFLVVKMFSNCTMNILLVYWKN